MQDQGLGAVLVIVGEYQFIVIYEGGIYESIDDFFSVIKVIDIAVLVFADVLTVLEQITQATDIAILCRAVPRSTVIRFDKFLYPRSSL